MCKYLVNVDFEELEQNAPYMDIISTACKTRHKLAGRKVLDSKCVSRLEA